MDEIRDAMQSVLNALWYCERIQPDLTPKLRDSLRLLIRKEYDTAIHQKVMEELNTIDPVLVDPLQFDDLFQTLFKEKQELFQPYTEDGHPLMIEFNRIIHVWSISSSHSIIRHSRFIIRENLFRESCTLLNLSTTKEKLSSNSQRIWFVLLRNSHLKIHW